MVAPLAVDLLLLRTALAPEIKIAPGRAIMARVVHADGSGRGSLSIAGALFEAELPKQVKAGADLRLVVRDVSADRVVLQLADQSQAGLAVPPPPTQLPGGGALKVVEHEQHRGGSGSSDGRDVLTVHYDAPNLGPVELRFDLRPGSLHVTATLTAGEPLRRAQADAVTLRAALESELDRPISVQLKPRYEPLDVYA
jgi:hypothetical protein